MEAAELDKWMNMVTSEKTLGEHRGDHILQAVCTAADTRFMTKVSSELEEWMNVVTSQRNTLRERGDTLSL
jgi:hypothetical protein